MYDIVYDRYIYRGDRDGDDPKPQSQKEEKKEEKNRGTAGSLAPASK
jgi:hypothetical protein